MIFEVVTCILLSSIAVLGQHPEPLALQAVGDDYYNPQDNIPDIFIGLGWFGGQEPEPEGNVGEVKMEYKEIVEDVMELITALKDFGLIVGEEVRIIKEIIHSKNP